MKISLFAPVVAGLVFLLGAIQAFGQEAASGNAEIFGWIEPVVIEDTGYSVEAKLDTGADHSSLSAKDMRRVRVGEKRYIRYTVRDPETDERVSVRSPYVRTTRIRNHSGMSQRRYVVKMTVCLGHHRRVVEVNLIDRTVFDYRLLLGRSALEGIAIVDPSVTHISEPDCTDGWKREYD